MPGLGTPKILRLASELVFVLLGFLLIQVAVSGKLFWNRRSVLWMGLAAFLIFRGMMAFMPRSRGSLRSRGIEHTVRASMLGLVGLLMMGIAWLPFAWVGPLLGAAGVILVIGGISGAVLSWRSP